MSQPILLLVSRRSLILPPSSLRAFSTSPFLLSKASRARVTKPPAIKPQPTQSQPIPERLRGTGVAADSSAFPAEESVVGRDESAAPSQINSTATEPPQTHSGAYSSLDFSKQQETVKEEEPRAFPSVEQRQADERRKAYPDHGEEETIYTANPPYNVPLVLSACFVFAVFSLSGADMARVGLAAYNEETAEYELAPKWKRYTFATGFAGVSAAIIAFGAIAPGRIVTKLTLARALVAPQGAAASKYPKNALVTIHTPITRLPGLSPRTVEFGKIQLLGPLATRPRAYHPRDQPTPERAQAQQGPLGKLLRPLKELLIAPAPKKTAKPWGKGALSHVPIHIAGDRFSMSMAIKRGTSGEPHDPTGAWCEDWEALERALLDVPEADKHGRNW